MVDLFETNDLELRELISLIDSGIDPEHVLLIRELNRPRALAAIIAFVVSAAIILFLLPNFMKHQWVIATVGFGTIAVVIAFLGIWLLQLFLNGNTFYVAMDDRHLILRRGPNRCELIPIEEMVTFYIEKGVLSVAQAPNDVKINIIKDAYSKESLRTVLDRLKSWRNSPHATRQQAMRDLNTEEYLRHRMFAIRLISTGFYGMITLVFLVFIDFQRINFLVAIMIPIKVFASFMSACFFLAGILLLFTARKKKPNANGIDFEID